jgi:small GTP-binding protein
LTKKIVLIGDSGVGKTSLMRRYILEQYDDKYIATIGVKVSKKSIAMEFPEGPLRLNMMIFDILGQRDFRSVRRMYLEGAEGAMIVGDLTRIETIEGIETFWIPELEKIVGEIPIILVGNKYDMSDASSEGVSLIRTIAGILRAPDRLTSAKTGENVEGAFAALAQLLMDAHQEESMRKEPITPIENLVHAADAIMKHFCESQDTPDVAIEICSAIFKEVAFDSEKPSRESLVKAIDLLAEQETGDLDEAIVRRHKEERLRIVDSVG